MTKLWVKFRTSNVFKVSTEECEDIDDFIHSCKKALSRPFDSIPTYEFILSAVDGGTPLKPDDPIPAHNTAKDPLFLNLTAASLDLKSFRLERDQKLILEASCKEYLNAIAHKLFMLYEFDYCHKAGPTIADVLAAKDGKEGEDWDFCKAMTTHQQIAEDDYSIVKICKGQRLAKDRLPDIYTVEEWDVIKRVNNGQFFQLFNGNLYNVIPHSKFIEELISFLKTNGVETTLVSTPDDLEMKDKDF